MRENEMIRSKIHANGAVTDVHERMGHIPGFAARELLEPCDIMRHPDISPPNLGG